MENKEKEKQIIDEKLKNQKVTVDKVTKKMQIID